MYDKARQGRALSMRSPPISARAPLYFAEGYQQQ